MTTFDLLNEGPYPVLISAPMVRYSSLPFRLLVRKNGCQVCFTPMIVADSFIKSQLARENDFKTNQYDSRLITQFAANDASTFSQASLYVEKYCDGVDLNCGCPQRWALQEGYGCKLLNNPSLIKDVIATTKRRISKQNFSVSVKIRIFNDIKKTVELCRQLEMAGVSFITVHGRTPEMRNQPALWSPIKDIVDSVRVPVVANGDIRNMADVEEVTRLTGVKGVMSARGILSNPCLYSGSLSTTACCIQDWVQFSLEYRSTFQQFHNHLIYMLESNLPRSQKKLFNSLSSLPSVIDYLQQQIQIPIFNNSEIYKNLNKIT